MFLAGQWRAWQLMQGAGNVWAGAPASSFVYLLTGAHALHLAGGLLALLYCAYTYCRGRSVEGRRITIDVTAWYWHFMGLLWLYLLGLLWFVGQS